MTAISHKRPVLLIDGGSRGDIGIIRSFGFGGVPVHLLVTDSRSTSTASRYVTQIYPFPGLHASDDACLAAIRAAARQISSETGQRSVMFAMGDRALALMSRRRDELAELVDHDLAPAEMIDTYLDKDRFAPVAQRLGLPVPETFVPESFAEARALADRLCYPVFVKPVDRSDWDRLPAGTVKSVKGQRFESSAELFHLVNALEAQDTPRFVVQRLVEGGDHEHTCVHAYILPDGTVAGTFTGTKPRISPPRAGVGALVVSRRMPELEAVARQVFNVVSAAGYTGFIDLQFKRDARRNVYELLEINCRFSMWTELPSRAGCNFPLTAYATVVGQPLPRLEQRENMAWLDLERDLKGMAIYRATGEWTWSSYIRSLTTVRCWAYFAWDDPGPFFRKVQRW